MILKKPLINIGLMILSLCACLLLGEGILRLFIRADDLMEPRRLMDSVLKRRVAPYSGGHDAWGYRNPTVPSHADIVIIGDSQSYGFNAPMSETWPSWVRTWAGPMTIPGEAAIPSSRRFLRLMSPQTCEQTAR